MTVPEIEDIYPLSPLQQGMLFHSLYAPESGEYFRQSLFELRGKLNLSAFERAWQRAVERHAVLRTAFVWEELDEPLQVVRGVSSIRIETHDLRGLTATEQNARREVLSEDDSRRGFDLSEAPLLRVTLMRTGDDAHECLLSYHHLVLDGWSKALLLKEVFALYQSFCGMGNEPRGRARPFRDYIAWLKQQNIVEAEEFWRHMLRGVSAPTAFGAGAAAGWAADAERGVDYGERRLRLSEPTTAALQALARRHHFTLNTLVQGAWAILLSRYSGELDVVFGATVSGRPPDLEGIEGMVGMFINTLPVRVRVERDARLLEWLGELQARQIELRQYEFSPLLQVQAWSEVPRGRSLFDSILIFENYPVDEDGEKVGTELEVRSTRVVVRTNYPLSIIAVPGKALTLWAVYDRARFDDATATRMLGHFETLLEGIAANPDAKLSTLPLLPENERRELLFERNQTATTPWPECSVHQLLEAQAARTPDAVAVVFDDEQLTYGELDARANRLANHLLKLGAGPDVLVGVCVERSTHMLVALLATMKSGAAYVPLDPTYPRERLCYMLEDSGALVLLTEESLTGSLPDVGRAALVRLDVAADWPEIARAGGRRPRAGVSPENLAYVIYTSGSTGKPKGVQIPHRAVVNFLHSMRRTPGLDAADALVAVTTLSFDIAALELFLPLAAGARLIVAGRTTATDGRLLTGLLDETGATIMQATPATWRQMIEAGWEGREGLKILCGGEALPQELARELGPRGGSLWNMYGPTETTIWSAVGSVQRGKETAGETAVETTTAVVPVGAPIANTQIYVLDEYLRPVPDGVAGELMIGGAGLARGYLGRPDLTADKFIPDPFAPEPGARFYRTGDLTAHLPEGGIEFLGRMDQQVKVRGFRIELGEIEAALAEHEAVQQSVAVAREYAGGDQRLVAYVVGDAERLGPGASALRAHLKERLPEYMQPSVFVLLDALPLTPNNKVDRKALPEPDWASTAAAGASFVAPRTPAEEVLAGIWAEVLKVGRVGVADNFFELGGHSLLATQIASRVRSAFGVELPLRTLFENLTVAALARKLEEILRGDKPGPPAPTVRPVARPVAHSGELPLSYAQQRLWFIDRLESSNPAYNVPAAFRVEGTLNLLALEQSVNEIVRRHEALRTTFAEREGHAIQVVASATAATASHIPVVDLGALPEAVRKATLASLMLAEARKPFDLARGPLFRRGLLRSGEGEYVLLFTAHHIVSDAWSIGVLVREVAALYEAFSAGGVSPLGELTIQYVDFALWQRAWLQGEVLEKQLGFWKEQLKGATPALDLPTDRPRPPVQSFRGARRAAVLPESLCAPLAELSRREGVSTFMTLLAVFQTLLYRYTAQTDIVIGTPIANRNRTEVESLIGFFDNTLALRTDFSGDPSVRELLARVRETTLSAYAHQDLPFEKLVEELQPERTLSHTPLFQVMFVMDNTPRSDVTSPGLKLSVLDVDRETAKFDLLLMVREAGGRIEVSAEYNVDLFDASTIDGLLGHFRTLLENVVADPDANVSALRMLTPAELQTLLVEWNDTATDYGSVGGLCELFERRCAATPDSVAVVFGGDNLTYSELNARANRLAHRLQTLGVGADSLVGVLMERSLEMAVGLLAILKCGAAYVPLDRAYPAERVSYMAEDSGMAVLLTQERLRASLPETGAAVVAIDSEWDGVERHSAANPQAEDYAEALAYVIYTSGSTGQPKGVSMTRGCLANLLLWQLARWDNSRPARTLQFTSLSFDVSFQEIFSTWLAGGTLVMVSDEVRRDPVLLWRLLDEQEVERLFLPYVALKNLAREGVESGMVAASLCEVITAGEALRVDHDVAACFSRLSGCLLENQYGPSESHVVTAHRLGGVPQVWPSLPPIGRPVANCRIHLLDDRLRPTPAIVPAELHIGGVSLGRGYLNAPGPTAEKFVPDPFAREAGARLYKTGDLARYRADGELEYLGRNDHQVKVRGYRVELGEVETLLSEHTQLAQAIVVAREAASGEKRLVAYVVPVQAEAAPSAKDLRAYLKKHLPDFMLPSAFVTMEKLPLTPSGKVDRRHLPEPEGSGLEIAATTATLRPVEEVLAGVWSEILGVERVGATDNFFELGGHSLLATQVASRVRSAFGVELPLRTLFETQNLAALVQVIEHGLKGGAAEATPKIERAGRAGALPLSFAQQRLWLLDQLEPGSFNYNNSTALRLSGQLNTHALEQSLAEVVRRHEVLRTTFRAEGGEPSQLVEPPRPLTLPLFDLRALAEEQREAEALRLITAAADRPFDLSRDPLLRAGLIRVGEGEHIALLTMHHIVSDAWAMGVLVREMVALYEAFSEGSSSPLAELEIQYADFAVWQRNWLRGEVLETHLDYWRRHLSGRLPVLNLPTDRPRPPSPSRRGARHLFEVSPTLHQELTRLSRAQGVTVFMVVLAAFKTLLHLYTKQTDIIVGADIANRDYAETESLIGFFINLMVLRTDLSGDPRFRELLASVREVTLGAYAHQDVPFEKLVEELRPERSMSHSPLFQVVFNFINTPEHDFRLPRLYVSPVTLEREVVRFDLSLFMVEGAGGLSGFWAFNTDLFDASTIARMSDRFLTLLSFVVERPESRLSALDALSEEQRLRDVAAESDKRDRREAVKKPMRGGRRAVNLSHAKVVAVTEGDGHDDSFPLVFKPDVRDVDLAQWAAANREYVLGELSRRGAILFRDFGAGSVKEFNQFVSSLSRELMDYSEPSTPRKQVDGKIYTSTEYPAEHAIPLHNEMSYSHLWPMKVWFFCAVAPGSGGETPIADSRRVFNLIPAEVRERFAEKGVMYVRNYGGGLGLPWQEVFGTSDKSLVEAFCASVGVEFEWRSDGTLRTRQIRQAAARHQQTGEMVWFNQAHVHHLSGLDAAARDSVLAVADDEQYPLDINACYGDGTPIELEALEEVRAAYSRAAVSFAWREGDILMLDNMLAAHGRAPFTGPRKILVAMAEPFGGNGHIAAAASQRD